MRNALLLFAVLLVGCHAGTPAADPMGEMADAVHPGMTPADVERLLGEPDKKMDDPTSGAELWSYHAGQGTGTLMVTFDSDGVVSVRASGM